MWYWMLKFEQVPTSLVYENETSVKASDVSVTEGRDVWWNDVIPQQSNECEIEWMDAEDPLFLLYTSGSTGPGLAYLYNVKNI